MCRHKTTMSYKRSMRPRVKESKINPPIKKRTGRYFSCLLMKFLNPLFLNLTNVLFIRPLSGLKYIGIKEVGYQEAEESCNMSFSASSTSEVELD